jgi:hypothetical protein
MQTISKSPRVWEIVAMVIGVTLILFAAGYAAYASWPWF